jgi:hypothetical protein
MHLRFLRRFSPTQTASILNDDFASADVIAHELLLWLGISKPQLTIGHFWRPNGLDGDVAAYVCLNAPNFCP